eukprot:TRINITY_DN43355_c0_g1_i1.p1 TRINITY_DN43355_c0_g1~~TRINITY_DN43355_c0_g1_i1.p1  ORF type:complete len:411 (+),score=137.55 TRINITY_DN43355_c0_g1_i1:122-1354(+)
MRADPVLLSIPVGHFLPRCAFENRGGIEHDSRRHSRGPRKDRDVANFLQRTFIRGDDSNVRLRCNYLRMQLVPAGLRREMARLRALGAEVGPRSYCTAIAAVARWGDTPQAELLWEDMLAHRVAPDRHLFNALLSGYARNGDLEAAESAVVDMRRLGIEPGPDTHDILLRAAARSGTVPWEQLCERLTEPHFSSSQRAHCTVAAAAPTVKQAFSVLEAAKRRGLRPRLRLCSALLTSCAREGNLTAAHRAAAELWRAGDRPDAAFYNNMMQVARKAGDFDGVLDVCLRMDRGKIQADTVTYTHFIHACADVLATDGSRGHRRHALTLAERTFAQARKERKNTGQYIYTAMMRVYAELGDAQAATNLRRELRVERIKESDAFLCVYERAMGLAEGSEPRPPPHPSRAALRA